ncbi:CHASE2 domain-containing protein [Pontibacterium granulatum]|uniref:CHASE2 domain-containing protein n=1 Tax=Pontibacterium granulatum TaxID=2036029 RepID=UPI00249AE3F6|nr:CHASE2 domain-containing protein [Pontibacterium granulatum]MDI3326586.1 CHASE2 domain-containing protein [Pontibacterium granulatum]
MSAITTQYGRYWGKLNRHTRHILINCFIGIIVVLIVHKAQDLKFISSQVAQGFDLMLRLQSNSDLEDVPPFVFLDIDSDSHLAWGEPVVTPRDKLAQLLEYALSSQAKAVILDIDLNLPVDSQPIESVLNTFGSPDAGSPPLILMKTFRELSPKNADGYRELRPSTLDSLVAKTAHYHWASPLFEVDSDFILRRWKQWVAGCSNHEPRLIPSSQLLLLAVYSDPTARNFYVAMEKLTPSSCLGWKKARPGLLNTTVQAGEHDIHWQGSDLQRLIMFNIGWPSYLNSNAGVPDTTLKEDGQAYRFKALTIIPAHIVTESPVIPDTALLKNHVVIIGNSSQYGGDLHATPLGLMPGSLVIVNAVHSLFSIGEIEPPPLPVILLIELGLLIGISLLFTTNPPGRASLLSTGLVVFVIFPIACIVFKEGVWLDFTLPLIAVELHELLAIAEYKFKTKKQEDSCLESPSS